MTATFLNPPQTPSVRPLPPPASGPGRVVSSIKQFRGCPRGALARAERVLGWGESFGLPEATKPRVSPKWQGCGAHSSSSWGAGCLPCWLRASWEPLPVWPTEKVGQLLPARVARAGPHKVPRAPARLKGPAVHPASGKPDLGRGAATFLRPHVGPWSRAKSA